jgi:hypothetical protein
MRIVMVHTAIQILLGGLTKEDEMGRTCGMYGGNRGTYRVLMGKRRERDHFNDLDLDGRIILK